MVCCSEVIEHVHDQPEFLRNCLKMVKPDGMFFFSTIAKTPEAYVSNILLGEYVLGLLPKGTHEYDLFMTQEEAMSHIADKMDLIEAKGVTVKNPFSMEMTEIGFLRANYMMMCRMK